MSLPSAIFGVSTNNGQEVDANHSAQVRLFNAAGGDLAKTKGTTQGTTDSSVPISGVNDGVYRPIRVGRWGSQAIERFTPLVNLNLFTAALPPTWLAPATTMTLAYATTSGVLINSAASVAASVNAALISFQTVPKYQKSPVLSRHRIRLIPGGANAIADWGLYGSQAPGSAIHTNALVFLYGADNTLKPTYYLNGAVVAQGTDFSGALATASSSNTKYFVYDIIVDDDSVTFICQDPTTQAIISEQVLQINLGDPRIALQPWFFSGARCYQTATAGTGAATQLYVSDASAGLFDTDANKPWSHIQSSLGLGCVVNPTVALTQLANYTNSAAPASATLSNTAAGYTNLGGQFQFATVAGAETDYALFGFQVPTGVKFVCTGVYIDTMNTGAAVSTTATWLQWFLGVDGTAVTLASNNFRVALGNQVFAIAAPIGQQATPISQEFSTPLVTHSGRFFHVGLKMPLGTATASQIIRGTVRVEGYFE